jgi:hypothetical protein
MEGHDFFKPEAFPQVFVIAVHATIIFNHLRFPLSTLLRYVVYKQVFVAADFFLRMT